MPNNKKSNAPGVDFSQYLTMANNVRKNLLRIYRKQKWKINHMYLFPVVFKAFFPGRDAQVPEVRDEAPWLMTVPMMFLCGVSLVMGVFGVQILQAAGF